MRFTAGSLCLLLVACADPDAMTADGSVVDPVACTEARKLAAELLAKEAPTRHELQDVIVRSAASCPSWQHGEVVQPICSAHPSACVGKLEEEMP